jgi:hypothetical protein
VDARQRSERIVAWYTKYVETRWNRAIDVKPVTSAASVAVLIGITSAADVTGLAMRYSMQTRSITMPTRKKSQQDIVGAVLKLRALPKTGVCFEVKNTYGCSRL